jgi:membrane-associated phospholipid phosphatase
LIGLDQAKPGLLDLHFNMRVLEFLAAHRSPLLTHLATAMSGLGDGRWYLLVVLATYVAWDKRLAVRLSILMTLSGSLNYILKTLIANPRPFVREDTYREKWAIPARNVESMAREYSTPSGHAMSASSFYSFLGGSVKDSYFKAIALLIILLVGVSRPYLGVHYVEDVLLGWAIGISVGLLSLRYADAITDALSRLSYPLQIAVALAVSGLIFIAAMVANHWRIDAGVTPLLSDIGMFTGVVIARPLELRLVDFDPQSSPVLFKALRFILTVIMAGIAVGIFGWAVRRQGSDLNMVVCGLQFIRYVLGGVVSIFLAPWVFTQMGLAQRMAA